MPSNVSNAIGTQKQFFPSPQGTYAKRLNQVAGNIEVQADTSNSGLLLAQALGTLGDAITTEETSREKRKEQLGISEAERIIAGRSEEDLKKMTAIEMLNNYGQFDTADNPYAITTIEKMRGKYLGARAKNEYELEVRQKEGIAKTTEEEVARYNKFIREKYGQYVSTTSDTEAFQKGFFDNHIVDQVEQANNQIKEKSEELDAIRKGTTEAELSQLVNNGFNLDAKSLAGGYNKIMAQNRLANASPTERIEQTKQFLRDYVQMTGDYTKVDYLATNGVLGVDDKGSPIKIKDVINLQDYKRAAELRTNQIYGERLQKSLQDLQAKGSMASVNKQYDIWKKQDPSWFNVMVPYRNNLEEYYAKLEEQKLKNEMKMSVDEHLRQMSFGVLEDQYRAYEAGNNKDSQGYVVASSYSDLPKFSYQTLDASGNPSDKKYEWSKEDVNVFIEGKLHQIMSSGGSPEERSAKIMKLLLFPPAQHYADTIKMQLNSAIDSLTVDKLGKDSKGNPVLTGQLQDSIKMYQTDPEAFQHLFGEDTTKNLETLQLLSQATGNVKEGVALFAQGRDKRNDVEFSRRVHGEISRRLGFTRLRGFKNVDGSVSKVDTALASNRSIMRRVESLAENLMFSGMTSENAVHTALEKVRKTSYVWRDTAVPRTIFNGIRTQNKAAIGKQVLDYYINDFAKKTGVNPMHIMTEYDVDRNVFKLSGGGAFLTYSINDITYTGNRILDDMVKKDKKNPPGKNVTLKDVQGKKPNKSNGYVTSYSETEHQDSGLGYPFSKPKK